MNEIIQEGRNREDALNAALRKLGVDEKDVEVETLESAREGFFGFLGGGKPVKLRVRIKPIGSRGETGPASGEESEKDPNSARAPMFKDDQTPEDVVRDFISGVLECFEIRCDIEVHEGENNIFVDIEGDDSGVIIGKFGQTLDALQFLTNVVISKKYGNRKKILVNVGDYRERRENSIRKLARSVARKVLKTRKPEALAPMPPQDRRIVHLSLASFDHIATTSEGEGQNRKVIISYKE